MNWRMLQRRFTQEIYFQLIKRICHYNIMAIVVDEMYQLTAITWKKEYL